MEDVDDLLGPVSPPAKVRKPRRMNGKKVDDLLGKRKYQPLKAPKTPEPGGIFAAREAKGRNLGKTCLICKVELKHKRGRPPVICGKPKCFRAYRNLYRHDYDRVRGAA
jgi:hypothetical protein